MSRLDRPRPSHPTSTGRERGCIHPQGGADDCSQHRTPDVASCQSPRLGVKGVERRLLWILRKNSNSFSTNIPRKTPQTHRILSWHNIFLLVLRRGTSAFSSARCGIAETQGPLLPRSEGNPVREEPHADASIFNSLVDLLPSRVAIPCVLGLVAGEAMASVTGKGERCEHDKMHLRRQGA